MKIIKVGTVLALFVANQSERADPLDTWLPGATPARAISKLMAIAYGHGQFVAVGLNGVIVTSGDGVNWVERQSGTSGPLRSIVFGIGQFEVVGWNPGCCLDGPGIILRSSDGVNWTSTKFPRNNFMGITYGNDKFLAYGYDNFSSTNGLDWVHTGGSHDPIGFGTGLFVALRNNTNGLLTALTSPDGVDWGEHETGIKSQEIKGIAYGNAQFVAVGNASYIIRANDYGQARILNSIDGVNWVERLATTNYALTAVTFAEGRFVTVGYSVTAGDSVILTSSDAVNWLRRPSPRDNPLSGVAFGNGHFVALGNTPLQSGPIVTLASTLNVRTGLLSLSLTGPTGMSYTIQSSTNLLSWQNVTNITSGQETIAVLDISPADFGQLLYRAYSR
jgi:hypothetical protein